MDIERKVSGARRTLKRVGTLHRTNSNARRAAARSKVARAEAAGRTPEGMPGIIGTAIPITNLDFRRKLLTSVGSQYLDRLRTARSSYFEEHPSDRPGARSVMGRQPSLADLQIVGQQVPVKTRRAPVAKPSEAELMEITEKLKGRALEVEAVLRRDFTSSPTAMAESRLALKAAMKFMAQLRELAESSDHLAGAIFQELLARNTAKQAAAAAEQAAEEAKAQAAAGGAGSAKAAAANIAEVEAVAAASAITPIITGFRSLSVGRDRVVGKVPLETLTDMLTVDLMVDAAQELCSLVRIKIEDDNDLGLASTVLEDSSGFFRDLEELAKWRELDIMVLLEELRMF